MGRARPAPGGNAPGCAGLYKYAPDHALEVTGPLVVTLFAASSAPDTDFIAKLVDVRPEGYAQNLADGIIRARYRTSRMIPTLLTPGQVHELTIDLWATSHVFLPGHGLRLEIASSNFPRFDRNLNTGEDQATGTVGRQQRRPFSTISAIRPIYYYR